MMDLKKIPLNKKVNNFGMLATPDRTNDISPNRTMYNNYQNGRINMMVHHVSNT